MVAAEGDFNTSSVTTERSIWCANSGCHAWEQVMEAFYRQVHALEGNAPEFPRHYPRGALLGCVWVAGCLPVQRTPLLWFLQATRSVLPGSCRAWDGLWAEHDACHPGALGS